MGLNKNVDCFNREKIKEILNNNRDITINFVGDSITWGESHCLSDETYVAVFAKMFAEKFTDYKIIRYDGDGEDGAYPIKSFNRVEIKTSGSAVAYFIRNGVCGNTVLKATARLDDFTGTLVNSKKPDLTFFMFGINDSLFDEPAKFVSPQQFKKNYIALLDLFAERNSDSDIVLCTPNWNDKPLKEYNAQVREICKERDLPFIDVFGVWERHYKDGAKHFGQGEWLAEEPVFDACHPTPVGAKVIGQYIFEEFIKQFDL